MTLTCNSSNKIYSKVPQAVKFLSVIRVVIPYLVQDNGYAKRDLVELLHSIETNIVQVPYFRPQQIPSNSFQIRHSITTYNPLLCVPN